jgi:hypothetical protein
MQRKSFAMRHLLADWNQWSLAERVTAVTLAVGALTIPAVFAAMA